MQLLNEDKGIYQQLVSMLEEGSLVHAFCFVGGSPLSRMALAMAFSEKLLGDHPEDLISVSKKKEKASITVEDIEELQSKLIFKPYGQRFSVIIEESQLMGQAAQNKLLKTLEEPVSPAVIMLLAQQKDALLPTVLSRCSIYHLADPQTKLPENISNAADMFYQLIREKAPFYRKKAVLEPVLSAKDQQRELSLQFLEALEQRLLEDQNPGPAEHLARARRAIAQNHNVSYTLKNMCLKI